MDKLCKDLGVYRFKTGPYHPQGNAVIESFHRNLNKGLCQMSQQRSDICFEEAIQLICFAYRNTLHSTLNETPAFATFGVDLRIRDGNHMNRQSTGKARINFLNNMRLNLQYQAYEKRLRDNDKTNQDRIPAQLERYQLVLLRRRPHEKLPTYIHNDTSMKLTPKWSTPHRVIEVYPGGTKGQVLDLLTGKTRDIHIQDVRFIQPPVDDTQAQEWIELLTRETEVLFDANRRREILEEFFEHLQQPDEPNHTGKKRRRQA
ncbi:hypothetical protein CAPTEDRAFT_213750 [Capitella teleta]|uniref:Integrase catalytic domain-containing protein n=1 Tax=Capitella teleta TaxID=283909 RepID=R7UNZ0_CAPTE|nr:hypothetical protein CAPTEDRAFT_213750 [Capitella teleta]|eukprot:ELU05081.1 hypothetical protein CAPTEDRAFT_213750 [Capitella teleta]